MSETEEHKSSTFPFDEEYDNDDRDNEDPTSSHYPFDEDEDYEEEEEEYVPHEYNEDEFVIDEDEEDDEYMSTTKKRYKRLSEDPSINNYSFVSKLTPHQYLVMFYDPNMINDLGYDEFKIDESIEEFTFPEQPLYFTYNFYDIFLNFVKEHFYGSNESLKILVKLRKYINRVLWNPTGKSSRSTRKNSAYKKKIDYNHILSYFEKTSLSSLQPIMQSTLIHYVQMFITYMIPEWNSEYIITGASMNEYCKERTITLYAKLHGSYEGSTPHIETLDNTIVFLKKYSVPHGGTTMTYRPPYMVEDLHENYIINQEDNPESIITLEYIKNYIDDITEKFYANNKIYHASKMKDMPYKKYYYDKQLLKKYNEINATKNKLAHEIVTQKNKTKKQMLKLKRKSNKINAEYKKIKKSFENDLDMNINIEYINRFVTRTTEYAVKFYSMDLSYNGQSGFQGIYNLKTGNNILCNSELLQYVLDDYKITKDDPKSSCCLGTFPNTKKTVLKRVNTHQLFHFLQDRGYKIIQILDESCEFFQENPKNPYEAIKQSHSMLKEGFGTNKKSRKTRKHKRNSRR